MKKVLLFVLAWTWELPQNIAGYIMSRLWKGRLTKNVPFADIDEVKKLEAEHGVKVYIADYEVHKNDKMLREVSGFSIGKFICLNSRHDMTTVRHEFGHSIQSRILGPLYLIVIGIYSMFFCNLWDRYFHAEWEGYDRLYWYYLLKWCERWADSLGGVAREKWLKRQYPEGGKRYPIVGVA